MKNYGVCQTTGTRETQGTLSEKVGPDIDGSTDEPVV